MTHPPCFCGRPGMIRASRGIRVLAVALLLANGPRAHSQTIDVNKLHLVIDGANPGKAGNAAAALFTDAIAARTGRRPAVLPALPASGPVILLRLASAPASPGLALPAAPALPAKPEAFRVLDLLRNKRHVVVVEGADARGILFGAGYLLRRFGYRTGFVELPSDLETASAPDKPIRGHQLGYRNTANSYDAWTAAQFEQYIRDLAVFGVNSIESIPIFSEENSPHFHLPPDEMNAKISAICDRYDLDYWIWVPAQFDARDTAKRNEYLRHIEKICRMSVRLDGVFFPGGDPGDNPPETVWPLLADIAGVVKKFHPAAKVWLSLQNFTTAQNHAAYAYVQRDMPDWLGGLVTGPSSPPVEETRAALPARYRLRYYPDLTHNVRSDFPVPWWDPFFNFTMGRECANPRAAHYAAFYRYVEPYMDGFISYSDGAHDDVNKIVWTRLAWDKHLTERQILEEYANFFFGSAVKTSAADGILALEKNWEGPAGTNGGVEATHAFWDRLAQQHPALEKNWRWQLCLLRENYDAYARARGLYEAGLEEEANDVLRGAAAVGAGEAMRRAQDILERTVTRPVDTALRGRIVALCEELYRSIGLQTSVKKYKASGEERGAVLDFIDYPLNNRWWMEDRFRAIAAMPAGSQAQALREIADWEHPGPGGYYDDIGNVAKSPHALRGESWATDPQSRKQDSPNFDWWDDGFSRQRQSWISNSRWPIAVEYNGLDSTASYLVRVTGFGECLLKVNGERVAHTLYGKGIGEIKEFPVPPALIRGGKISVSFDDINEDNINWRQQSRVTEIWLIKNPG